MENDAPVHDSDSLKHRETQSSFETAGLGEGEEEKKRPLDSAENKGELKARNVEEDISSPGGADRPDQESTENLPNEETVENGSKAAPKSATEAADNLRQEKAGKSEGGHSQEQETSRADRSADRHKEKGREKDRGKDRGRDRERERDRDHSSRRDKDKDKERHREHGKDQDKERDRDRHRGRDRDKDRGKESKRSRDDDRDRPIKDSKRSRRSSSRERSKRRDSREHGSSRRSDSRSKARSRSRRSPSRERYRRRSSSRDRGYRGRRRDFDSDSDDGFGGYVPRKRQEPPQAAAGFSTAFVDPYAALRSKQPLPTDPEGIKREMAEQQLRARQMVLQQQAASAVAAASKTQREIYVGNLVQGLVTEDALRQLFNSTMKAAFPEQQVQLLGQSISVGRPSGYVDPSAAQMAAAQAATALSAFELGQSTLQEATEAMNTISMPGVSASQPPGTSPSPQAPLALPAPPPIAATPYLQIVGMVTAEVLADNEEYSEVIEDIQEECGKYGQIIAINVPRPADPSQSAVEFGKGNFGKAFVHFADPKSCQQSKEAVHGRLFAGVSLQANFISEAEFKTALVPAS